MKSRNILLLGSGGREHALAWKLNHSPRCRRLCVMPGSDGIGRIAECFPGDPTNVGAVVETARKLEADLVVVGPEAPLAAGVVDALSAAGIRAFGPTRAAAQLEASKAFAKDFMKRHGIPTAAFEVFESSDKALTALDHFKLPVVVKADGLAAGKGVRVCQTRQEAVDAINDFMVERSLGNSGARVVLEECLEGPEVTLTAVCDGREFKVLPTSRDHKRLEDGDAGPNTGGMGAMAPVNIPTSIERRVRKDILDRVIAGFRADKLDYRGVLYCGLMLTREGPKVLEFNVRFGDPETQVVLPLLVSDLIELMEACIDGKLRSIDMAIARKHAVSVVLASEGYPSAPKTGRLIEGLDGRERVDTLIFYAGVKKDAGAWKTAGGRVLNITGIGRTLEEARSRAYAAAEKIQFEGMHYRKDIAVTEGNSSQSPSPPERGRGQGEGGQERHTLTPTLSRKRERGLRRTSDEPAVTKEDQ